MRIGGAVDVFAVDGDCIGERVGLAVSNTCLLRQGRAGRRRGFTCESPGLLPPQKFARQMILGVGSHRLNLGRIVFEFGGRPVFPTPPAVL